MPQMSPMVWLMFPVVVLVMNVMMMIVNVNEEMQVGFEDDLVVMKSVKVKW